MYSPLCIQSYSKLVFVQKNPFESRITTNVGPKQTKQRPALLNPVNQDKTRKIVKKNAGCSVPLAD